MPQRYGEAAEPDNSSVASTRTNVSCIIIYTILYYNLVFNNLFQFKTSVSYTVDFVSM